MPRIRSVSLLLPALFLACALPLFAQAPADGGGGAGGGAAGGDAREKAFDTNFQAGMDAIDKGQFEEGIASFKKAIEAAPDDPTSYYNIACCYARLGKKPEAIEWLRKSVEKGFLDVEHIEKDTDLDAIRTEKGYQDALAGLKAAVADTAPPGELQYELVVPKMIDKTKPTPLIVALHGNGGESKVFANLWRELAESAGVMVACPQGPHAVPGAGFSWEGSSPDLFIEVISKVQDDYEVDETHVYLAGFSLGGTTALQVALHTPETFAGVLSMCGDYSSERMKDALVGAKAAGLGVALFAGEKDAKFLPQARQAKADAEGAGVSLLYKEYPIAHDLPPNPKDELAAWYKWASALPRSPKPAAAPEGLKPGETPKPPDAGGKDAGGAKAGGGK